MSAILIRAARLEELSELQRFEQAIVSAERPYDPTLRNSGVRYYDIEAILRNPEARFAVAESANELIGCGFARIEAAKPFLDHDLHAYLGLMYVDPRHRGRGINRRIIDDLKDWCRARQVYELKLDVYAGNQAAVRAYEKAGFEGLLLQMRVNIGPRGEV
jgi:GNAT superfamily N-acetyltransferase